MCVMQLEHGNYGIHYFDRLTVLTISKSLLWKGIFIWKNIDSGFSFFRRPSLVACDAFMFSVDARFPGINAFRRDGGSLGGWNGLSGERLCVISSVLSPFACLLTTTF